MRKPRRDAGLYIFITMQNVNVYIDGFNFYNGLRDSDWKDYYWLNIAKFGEAITKQLSPTHTFIKTYYFSAPPHNHPSKERRQKRFFDANEHMGKDKFKLIKGYHRDKSKKCAKCKKIISMSEEKQTDVNIALWMLKNAVQNTCNLSILVSGDTDMIPIIESIKEISPSHKIMAFFPPARKSYHLMQVVDGWRDLADFENLFKASLLPELVRREGAANIEIPQKWKNFKTQAEIFAPLKAALGNK